MTTFTAMNFLSAVAVGLIVGVGVVSGLSSMFDRSSQAALAALRQRMGSVYSGALFASGALPTIAMWLAASQAGAPTLLDAMILIVLIGSGMIASYTILGNVLKLVR